LTIYVILGGRVFQHSRHFYGYQLLIADLIHYSYDTEFIQRLLKKNEKKLAISFNFTFCNMAFHKVILNKCYEKTEEAIKIGQSGDTGNIGHT